MRFPAGQDLRTWLNQTSLLVTLLVVLGLCLALTGLLELLAGPYRVPGLIKPFFYTNVARDQDLLRFNISVEPKPPKIDNALWTHALSWANNPTSFCFQSPELEEHGASLTIITAALGLEHNTTVAIRLNRVLMALEQNVRYCHFVTFDPTRAATWGKVLAAKQALVLSPYVLWLDADAAFMRYDIPLLKTLVTLLQDKDVLFSTEFNQPSNATDESIDAVQATVRINAGVVFFKSTDFTFRFLDSVYAEAPKWTYWLLEKDQSGFDYWHSHYTDQWLQHIRIVHYRYFNGHGSEFGEDGLVFHESGGVYRTDKFRIVAERCLKYNCRSRLWKGRCDMLTTPILNAALPGSVAPSMRS